MFYAWQLALVPVLGLMLYMYHARTYNFWTLLGKLVNTLLVNPLLVRDLVVIIWIICWNCMLCACACIKLYLVPSVGLDQLFQFLLCVLLAGRCDLHIKWDKRWTCRYVLSFITLTVWTPSCTVFWRHNSILSITGLVWWCYGKWEYVSNWNSNAVYVHAW